MTGKTCIIPLGRNGQHEAIVSEEDYAFLTQWRWSFKVSSWQYGRKIYARRHQRIDGVRHTVLMHILILRERLKRRQPTDLHTGDHFNRDSLNNTRSNLRWASKRTQVKNQKPRITAAEKAAYQSEQIAA